MFKIYLSILLNFVCVVIAIERNESDFYIGGVVEYSSQILSDLSPKISIEKYIQDNLNEYLKFIKSAKDQNVDILVFPEATLNYVRSRDDMIKYGFEIPNPKGKIAPWKYPELYAENLRKISKEVKDNEIYILVNLIEKEPCYEDLNDNNLKETNIKCIRKKANGYNIYNANVVFDRQGQIISRYRKYNLFNEHLCDKPDVPELSHFQTDFGVKFGHFICFDIMFKEPALSLVRKKQITNILYPSMWFSELPFLTSIQTHFGWAYANNINFLSAGGNNPHSGSGGTGIISGNKYIANTLISGKVEKQLMISELPKQINNYKPDINRQIIKTPSIINSPIQLDKFHVTENWSKFGIKMWNITNNEIERICIQTDICCTFDIRLKEYNLPPEEIMYHYKLVANYTTRIYSHDRNCGELYCSVVACTKTNDPASCGTHFKDNTKLFNGYQFEKIKITANVKVLTNSDDLLIMPSSLSTSLIPLDLNLYKFDKLQGIRESGFTYDRYQIESKASLNDLLTFGIYGRIYALDQFV